MIIVTIDLVLMKSYHVVYFPRHVFPALRISCIVYCLCRVFPESCISCAVYFLCRVYLFRLQSYTYLLLKAADAAHTDYWPGAILRL